MVWNIYGFVSVLIVATASEQNRRCANSTTGAAGLATKIGLSHGNSFNNVTAILKTKCVVKHIVMTVS